MSLETTHRHLFSFHHEQYLNGSSGKFILNKYAAFMTVLLRKMEINMAVTGNILVLWWRKLQSYKVRAKCTGSDELARASLTGNKRHTCVSARGLLSVLLNGTAVSVILQDLLQNGLQENKPWASSVRSHKERLKEHSQLVRTNLDSWVIKICLVGISFSARSVHPEPNLLRHTIHSDAQKCLHYSYLFF